MAVTAAAARPIPVNAAASRTAYEPGRSRSRLRIRPEAEAVANPDLRDQVARRTGVIVQLVPEVLHMRVHRALLGRGVEAPRRCDELVAGEGLAGVIDQCEQDVGLGPRELGPLTADEHGAGGPLQDQATGVEAEALRV